MSAGYGGDRKGSCGSSCGSVAHFSCPAVYALGSWEVALTSHAHCGRSFGHQKKVKYAPFKPPFLFSRLMVHITNLSQSFFFFFFSSEPRLDFISLSTALWEAIPRELSQAVVQPLSRV